MTYVRRVLFFFFISLFVARDVFTVDDDTLGLIALNRLAVLRFLTLPPPLPRFTIIRVIGAWLKQKEFFATSTMTNRETDVLRNNNLIRFSPGLEKIRFFESRVNES